MRQSREPSTSLRTLTADDIKALVQAPDLAQAGTSQGLELTSVPWRETMLTGYLGHNRRWDR